MLRTAILTAGLVALATSPSFAQSVGDYVLSDSTSNLVVTGEQTSGLSPIFSPRANHRIGPVMMDRNNDDLMVLEIGAQPNVVSALTRFDPVVTVDTYNPNQTPSDMDLDAYGNYIVGHTAGALTFTAGAGVATLSTTLPTGITGICVDHDTAGFAVITSSGTLLQLTGTGSIQSTLRTNLVGASDIEHDCRTGDYIIANRFAPHVRRIDRRTGATVDSFSFPVAVRSINVSSADRRVDVCGGMFYRSFELNGTPKGALGIDNGRSFISITRFGEQNLSARGSGTPGSTHDLQVSFPGSAFKTYVIGVSSGLRPGFQLGGKDVCLVFDALLNLSLTGALDGVVFRGRVGALNGQGEASAQMKIPGWVPIGTMLYLAAVAVNGPNDYAVSDSIGVMVR